MIGRGGKIGGRGVWLLGSVSRLGMLGIGETPGLSGSVFGGRGGRWRGGHWRGR